MRRLPAGAVVPVLRRILEEGGDRARREAVEVAGRLPKGGEAAGGLLEKASVDPLPAVRRRAAAFLARDHLDLAASALERLAADPDRSVAAVAGRGLATAGRLADGAGLAAAAAVPVARRESLRGLAEQAAPADALSLLGSLCVGETGEDQLLALHAVERMAEAGPRTAREGARELLLELARSCKGSADRDEVAVAAAWALARVWPGGCVELVESCSTPIRAAVAWSWSRGEDLQGEALERLRSDRDPGVRWLLSLASETTHKAAGPGELPRGSMRIRDPVGLPRHLGPLPGERTVVPLAVAALSPAYNLNTGVLIRTAEAAGAAEFFLVGKPDYHVDSARGTDGFLPPQHLEDPRDLLAVARARGYQVVAVQQGHRSVPYAEAPPPPRPLFVLGNEDRGVPDWFCAAADLVVEIPLHGAIDSLNVGCAASVVVFDWLGRRPNS